MLGETAGRAADVGAAFFFAADHFVFDVAVFGDEGRSFVRKCSEIEGDLVFADDLTAAGEGTVASGKFCGLARFSVMW